MKKKTKIKSVKKQKEIKFVKKNINKSSLQKKQKNNFQNKKSQKRKTQLNNSNLEEKTDLIWIKKLLYPWKKSSKKKKIFLYSKLYQYKTNAGIYYLKTKTIVKHKYRIWKKYRKLILVRATLKSLWFSRKYLNIKPWEFISVSAKERLKWLDKNFTEYNNLPRTKTANFLQSLYGSLLLENHKQTSKLSLMSWSWQTEILKFLDRRRHAWWYDNLRKHTKVSDLNQRNTVSFQNLSQLFWAKDIKNTWLSPLIFKRGLITTYSETRRLENKGNNYEIKNYARRKNPLHTKKFSFYKEYENLILKPWTKGWNKKKKWARGYHLTFKIISSFYGETKLKRIKKIWIKNKKKKSIIQTQSNNLFSRFERRLDVLVYRLNLAPTILWARRLIWEGSIFVANITDMVHWNENYYTSKIYKFPIKLRDPKNLYASTYWNPQRRYSELNYITHPILKENYLVKQNEMIQYNNLSNLNLFKTHSFLYQKGIASNLLTNLSGTKTWNWGIKNRICLQVGKYKQEILQTNNTVLLFAPNYNDSVNKNDRIKERFLNWVSWFN